MKQVKSIALCSSASFYKQVWKIKTQLEKFGWQVFVPHTAELMNKTGNYKVYHYKIWMKNKAKYRRKAYLMRRHLDEVKKADSILVINLRKKGIEGYIGGNVLMEMASAFYLKKSIYLWNKPSDKNPLYEELWAYVRQSLIKNLGN